VPTSDAVAAEPRPSYRGLAGLLTAEAVSLSGTRLSMIAIPWFVISSTGSPLLTGLVAFAETAPYVVAKALGGPLIDRLGARRVAIAADAASMAAVAAIPLLHTAGFLPIGLLIALVAVLGLWRGPADAAKKTLIPEVVDQARVPLERATGLSGTLERLATTVGAAAAGAVVATVGPLTALVVNATTFAAAPTLIYLTVRASSPATAAAGSGGGYLVQLRAGFSFLARERLLRSLAGMIAVTNLLEAAMASVLLPVWAHATGHGPAAIGLLAGASAAAAICSSLLASVLAHRLPAEPPSWSASWWPGHHGS
jgi:nitrate/nitrite transporter NarK